MEWVQGVQGVEGMEWVQGVKGVEGLEWGQGHNEQVTCAQPQSQAGQPLTCCACGLSE